MNNYSFWENYEMINNYYVSSNTLFFLVFDLKYLKKVTKKLKIHFCYENKMENNTSGLNNLNW